MTIIGEAIKGIASAGAAKITDAAIQRAQKKGPQAPRKRAKTPTRKRRAAAAAEDPSDTKLARALHQLRTSHAPDAAGQDFREELFDELRKLIPNAIRQAKKGKPALLRILTRYSR